MRTRLLAAATAVTLVATSLLASGCGGPDTVTARYDQGAVTLTKGQVLRIDFGTFNASIGDSWSSLDASGDKALSAAADEYNSDCKGHETGCGGHLYWRFTAVARGAETIRYEYCFRSGPPTCQPEPGRGPTGPISLSVTVR